MPPNLNDPRVKKTRRGLREAFIRLIMQKGYESISIQDIANEAETARITFYRHYGDKEGLLLDCLNVLYDQLVEKTGQKRLAGAPQDYYPAQVFYEHLGEQEELYRILFSSVGAKPILERLRHYLAGRVIEDLAIFSSNIRPDIPDEIIAFHIVSALIGLGIWWLEQNKPYPVDYMAQISLWLSFAGVFRSLGIEQFSLPIPGRPPAK
jgi:AcrR family transcriptional regulator